MNLQMIAELAKRRAAAPAGDWDAAEDWVALNYTLIPVGAQLSLMLPDGKPFTAQKLGSS
jgi:hypothetical protein